MLELKTVVDVGAPALACITLLNLLPAGSRTTCGHTFLPLLSNPIAPVRGGG
jgi:hypothetical protein